MWLAAHAGLPVGISGTLLGYTAVHISYKLLYTAALPVECKLSPMHAWTQCMKVMSTSAGRQLDPTLADSR